MTRPTPSYPQVVVSRVRQDLRITHIFQQTDVNLTRNGLFFPAIQAFFVLA